MSSTIIGHNIVGFDTSNAHVAPWFLSFGITPVA